MRAHTCATRALASRAAGAFALIIALATARLAKAQEGPPSERGISLDGSLAALLDLSVSNADTGEAYRSSSALFGLTALGNFGALVLGANVDGVPAIFGDGRLSVGGLVGWQESYGRARVQLLAEVGGHRFSEVGGNFFNTQLGDPIHWLPYVGARLGVSTILGFGSRSSPPATTPRVGGAEIGLWLFARQDMGGANVTSASEGLFSSDVTYTNYRLGGFQAGLALRFGMRVERRRPAGSNDA